MDKLLLKEIQEELAEVDYNDLTGENYKKYRSILAKRIKEQSDPRFPPSSPSLVFENHPAEPVFNSDRQFFGVKVNPESIGPVHITVHTALSINDNIEGIKDGSGQFLLIPKSFQGFPDPEE